MLRSGARPITPARDPSLLSSFEALRLNAGMSDVAVSALLAAATWAGIEGEAERAGAVMWGIDLGTSSAQSAIARLLGANREAGGCGGVPF